VIVVLHSGQARTVVTPQPPARKACGKLVYSRESPSPRPGGPKMTMHQQAQEHLRQFIKQIERLEEEKKAIADDIKDKFAEAKAVGFDVKALRKIIALRKKSQDELSEEEAILATYLHALGMADTYDELVLEAAE
jgi:uncharacterized protein (UPF0335 family)